MIAVRAVVVRAGEGKISAKLLENQGGCGHCDEPGGCHAPQFADLFKGGEHVFTLDDPIGLAEGERVKLVVDDGQPLRAALASYGLGTALVLVGAAFGVWLAPLARADIGAGIGAALGATATVWVLQWRARRGVQAWRVRVERDDSDPDAAPVCRSGLGA